MADNNNRLIYRITAILRVLRHILHVLQLHQLTMWLSMLTNRFSPKRVISSFVFLGYFVLFYKCFSRSDLPNKANNYFKHPHKFQQQNVSKTILVWNGIGLLRVEAYSFGEEKDVFANQNCFYTRCEIFHDSSQHPLTHYDAIVVLLNDQFTSAHQLIMPDFQHKRKASQRVVFFTQEAPPALKPYYDMSRMKNFFNWTMTYRTDADIAVSYGQIIQKERAPQTAEEISFYRDRARSMYKSKFNKTKTIGWMVSHCETHGQRETYVKELSKYIDVDIFGKCGNMSCAAAYTHAPHCYKMLESTYKFYLSFENAICPDYVTEKFFQIMDHEIVPIVYGGADYTKHAPPHSYIDARQFKPKELAAYIKKLDADDALYNEYFWWKDLYRVEYSVNERSRHAFCDLCQKLHESDENDFQSYREMESVWGDQMCTSFNSKAIL